MHLIFKKLQLVSKRENDLVELLIGEFNLHTGQDPLIIAAAAAIVLSALPADIKVMHRHQALPFDSGRVITVVGAFRKGITIFLIEIVLDHRMVNRTLNRLVYL